MHGHMKVKQTFLSIPFFRHVISRFRRDVNEIFALLGCYAAQMGSKAA